MKKIKQIDKDYLERILIAYKINVITLNEAIIAIKGVFKQDK